MIPGTVLLSGIVRSTAYGLADEFSDVDRIGMFALPTAALLGLARPAESHVSIKPDATYHEADTRKRTSKHARHLWRLLYQGSMLHQTGNLVVALPPDRADTCRTFGERVAAGDLSVAAQAFADAEAIFDGPGELPAEPDRAAAGCSGSAASSTLNLRQPDSAAC
jgi:hypothetical protein